MSASRIVGNYCERIGEIRRNKLHKKWLKDCENKAAREIACLSLIDAKTKIISNEYFLTAQYPGSRQAYYKSWRFEDYRTQNSLKSSGLVTFQERLKDAVIRFFIMWIITIVLVSGWLVLMHNLFAKK